MVSCRCKAVHLFAFLLTMATSTSTSAAAPFVRCLLPRPPSSSLKTKDGTPCSNTSNKRSRLVLLQHTADLTTRLTASSPADASATDGGGGGRRGGRRVGAGRKSSSGTVNNGNATSEDALYRLAGLRTPSESATRDLAGGLLALSALEEVAVRTEGRVVWVSLANHLSVPSRGGDGGTAYGMDDSGWAAQFQRNGVTVDLASDPLGWDESDVEEDGENKEDDDDAPSTTHRCYSSRMDSLKGVATTIERAAASIASAEDGDGNEAATRDIPVIFDSIAPLLSYHGSAKTYRFLQRLLGRGMVGYSSDGASSHIALSPIVAPISIESIQPADMRRFEDEADAIVTLSGGEMRTMRRGGGDGKAGGAAGRLGTDVQQFSLEQNQLQKQQQPGVTGLVYKSAERLVLLKSSGQSDKEERKKVVVQRKTKDRTDASGGDESLLPTATEKLASMELASPTPQAPTASSLSSQRSRPTLQIGEKGRDTANSAAATKITTDNHSQIQPTTKLGPRIFVQDDDPEFDDMDEEDLDDDLDL